jgi:hypothetical protein
MAAVIPPVYLPANPTPGDRRYGLFDVAPPQDLPNAKAGLGGLQYVTSRCDLPNGYQVQCASASIGADSGPSTITSLPFVVQAVQNCGTIGWTPEQWQAFIVDKLETGEQAVVERVFSAGTFAQAPSLGNSAATDLGTAANIDEGIGKLESWLYAQYGPTGVLHIPMLGGSYVYSDYHVLKNTQAWETQSRTKVSFGNYANVGPTGTAASAGTAYFYITGQVATFRAADIFVSPYGASIDKVTNQIQMMAEREWVVSYECYAAAILVTLTSPS